MATIAQWLAQSQAGTLLPKAFVYGQIGRFHQFIAVSSQNQNSKIRQVGLYN